MWTRGSRSVCIELETASIPVKVPPPIEKARSSRAASPTHPICPRVVWKSLDTSDATIGRSATWRPIAYRSSGMWLSMNTMKMGVKTATDSLTPRRFIQMRMTITAVTNPSLRCRYWGGRMLKKASVPAATDMVIVRM